VQVGLRVPRVVKVDDNVHRHYVDTSCEEVGAYQASRVTVFKIVVNPIKTSHNANCHLPVAIVLIHPGMNVEATVSERVDLLG